MLSPGGTSHHIRGAIQLKKCHCQVNGDSLLLSPRVILLKEGLAHQGGAVLPLMGRREGHGILAPLSKVAVGRGAARRPEWLGPATAGLSVKGLPVTKNFL